jgi:hypothetical protein
MKIKNIISLGLSCAVLLSSSQVTAFAAEKSLYTLEDKNGVINLTINGDRKEKVVIEKYSDSYGTVTCYSGEYTKGTYEFILSSNEYNVKNKSYDSYYTLKVTDTSDKKSVYTSKKITVRDTGFETDITKSEFDFTLNFSEDKTNRSINTTSEKTATVNGVYTYTTSADIVCRKIMLGDVNGDEKINSADAVEVLRAYANAILGNSTDIDKEAADTDDNGEVNSSDAVRILIYYANSLINSKIGTLEEFFA